MNGNGGMVSSRFVAREAAKTVMSGPASGVMAAAYTGRIAGMPDLLTYDMGGTSTDVALVRGAEPAVSNEIEIEYAMPIHVPMVDVRSVGAGGGSIARVNAAGSAGGGPAERRRRSRPDLLWPRRDGAHDFGCQPDPRPARPRAAGGPGGVTLEAVRAVFAEKLGRPLGLGPEEAAQAVVRLANTTMAGAIRMVSLSLGADPRDFALFAFGGAGPLHAAALAHEAGRAAGAGAGPAGHHQRHRLRGGRSAARFRADDQHAARCAGAGQLAGIFRAQREEGERLIAKERVEIRGLRHLYSVDMQFAGQTHLLRVELDSPEVDSATLQGAVRGRLLPSGSGCGWTTSARRW